MAFTTLKKIVSPKGIAQYPKLSTPDDYMGTVAYKCNLILDPAEEGVTDFIEEVEMAVQASFAATKAELNEKLETAKGKQIASIQSTLDNLKPHNPCEDEYADDGSLTGRVIFKYKRKAEGVYASGRNEGKSWTHTLPIFDANKKPLPQNSDKIGMGSILRLQAELLPFSMPSNNIAGISLRLFAVQVIELSGSGGANADGFDVEEGGYSAPDAADLSSTEDDSSEDDSADF